MSVKMPCMECQKRHLGCHAECEEYKEAKAVHDELKRKHDEAMMIDRINVASARKGTSIRRKYRRYE